MLYRDLLKWADSKQEEPIAHNLFELEKHLTPDSILKTKEFDEPYFIAPQDFKTFDDLLEYKDAIRDLKLVPLKDDTTHDKYNSSNKAEMLELLKNSLDGDIIVTSINEYPYHLPADCEQNLIWIVPETDNVTVHLYISLLLKYLELDLKDVIFFERPLNIKSKFVKGTFPYLRHIHFWRKIR